MQCVLMAAHQPPPPEHAAENGYLPTTATPLPAMLPTTHPHLSASAASCAAHVFGRSCTPCCCCSSTSCCASFSRCTSLSRSSTWHNAAAPAAAPTPHSTAQHDIAQRRRADIHSRAASQGDPEAHTTGHARVMVLPDNTGCLTCSAQTARNVGRMFRLCYARFAPRALWRSCAAHPAYALHCALLTAVLC